MSAGLLGACSVGLSMWLGTQGAAAKPMGSEDDTVTFGCTSVTYSFTGFPNAKGNVVNEFVEIDGTIVARPTFSFDGPSASNVVSVLVPFGHHAMDARASWNTNGVKGGRDRKLPGGIVCTPAPRFAIVKLQRVVGAEEAFAASPLSAGVGQTIAYEIAITNTGNVALGFPSFADPRCDAGTISGGPGLGLLAPLATTRYLCQHTLTPADQRAGAYPNTVTMTAVSSEGGDPFTTETSNTVVVTIPPPAAKEEAAPPKQERGEESPPAAPPAQSPPSARSSVLGSSALQPGALPAPAGDPLAAAAQLPTLTGSEGCVPSSFVARLSAGGVASVSFSLDGHRLGTLPASKAHRGRLSIRINVHRLALGPHRLTVRITMTSAGAAGPLRVSRTLVFLRCDPPAMRVRFTG
jgi:hypothetical protein